MATTKHIDPLKMKDEDWHSLRLEIENYFTPGRPVQERDLILGRIEQIQRLCDCARMPGRHAIMYGERGVGKSSIGNTFHYFISGDNRKVQHVRVQAIAADDFSSLWLKVFKRLSDGHGARIADRYEGKRIIPDDVLLELENFSATSLPIIVIDELDRLTDATSKVMMSDTIKMISDEVLPATIVCIGVADAVDTLIVNHQSTERALIQIEMPRMVGREIRDIIQRRIRFCGMIIAKNALERMVFVAKGLPHYAHLLGLHTAQASCDRRASCIEFVDVEEGIARAIADVGHTMRDLYEKATYSERKGALFKEVLLACCLADRDASGRFTAKGVANHINTITGLSLDVPQFSYHLNDFCDEKRGPILEKTGNKRRFKYRFREALVEPYVIAQSLKQKIVTEEKLRSIIPQQVPDLFST